MEVPHKAHPHESTKSWKSYIGEFLMLFLAVFSGFIAENLRENYVEKEKAHEYINSMINDLQKDTLQLVQAVRVNKKLLKGIDSLLFYLKAPASDMTAKKLYVFGSYVGASVLFESENGTITQLKNAGGLRLIKDTASANHIMEYDQLNELTKKQGDAYYKLTLDVLNLIEQLMDFSVTANPSPKNTFYIDKDPARLRYFYNKCYMQKQIITGYCNYLDIQKNEAVKTIAVLRKNYHLN
ncbi:MAG: hypothetical protein ABIS69_01130 [Sediminibacterium sp.]